MVLYRFLLLTLLNITLLFSPTIPVNIIYKSYAFSYAFRYPRDRQGKILTVTCTNIPPGVCCLPITPNDHGGSVRFTHLFALDIAVIWQPRSTISATGDMGAVTACSGRLLDSHQGPGIWLRDHRQFQEGPITGALYITLPRSLPPEDGASAWMMIEGLLALAWGGGKWFANAAGQELVRDIHYGPWPRSQARRQRDIRSEKKGSLYAWGPIRRVTPDRIQFGNGTVFTRDGGMVEGMFVNSASGGMVNLTGLFVAG